MLRREFIAGLGVLAVSGPQATQAAVRDPLPAEGVGFTYRVLFSGSEIGTQTVSIREHDKAGHVVVEHKTKLKVRILFAVVYALDHHSTEVWEGFTLKSMRATTVENGEKSEVEGDASADGFQIRSADKKWVAPPTVVTSDSFWIATAMDSPSIVNTQTGDTAAPKVQDLGNGRWHLRADFAHGPVEATVRFDGEFLAEAEVDSDGHKVRLERLPA